MMNADDFPLLQNSIEGRHLIYLNSAATTQKPKAVIEAFNEYYSRWNANLHRGSDILSIESEKIYESTRKKTAEFIHAHSPEEIVFTKSCTEAINIVAKGFPFNKGDRVVVSVAEHHANFVPWKMLEKQGIIVDVLDIDEQGKIIIDESMISKSKFVAITHVSNVLGSVQDVRRICDVAHKYGAVVLVDGAQSVGHMPVNVQDLDCDFLAFSGHKMLAGQGVGILYGKKQLLEKIQPLIYGGDMIKEVSIENISFAEVPRKFEGGTQNVAAIYSFGKALNYVSDKGVDNISSHLKKLTLHCYQKLNTLPFLKIYSPESSHGIISFTLEGIHPHDVAEFLSSKGIAVRAGHMCCQPLMKKLQIQAVVRASFYCYNAFEDIDLLTQALNECFLFFNDG